MEMIRKPSCFQIGRGDQYKLMQILVSDQFFSRDDLAVENAKGILLEVYQYEEKYKTIDFRLFSTLNPGNSSIYFKRIPQLPFLNEGSVKSDGKFGLSIERDECTRIMTSKINWICKLLGHKKNWLNKIVFLEEDLSNDDSFVLNSADVIIQAYPLVSELNICEKRQEIVMLKSDLNQDLF